MFTYCVPVPLQHVTVVISFVTLTPWRGCHELQLVHEVSGGSRGPRNFLKVTGISWLSSLPGRSWVFTQSGSYLLTSPPPSTPFPWRNTPFPRSSGSHTLLIPTSLMAPRETLPSIFLCRPQTQADGASVSGAQIPWVSHVRTQLPGHSSTWMPPGPFRGTAPHLVPSWKLAASPSSSGDCGGLRD